MKIMIVVLVMLLTVGCASSPRTYDSKQTQLDLTHIVEVEQWVEIYPYGTSYQDSPTIMQATKVDSESITGDHVSIAGNYFSTPIKRTYTYDEIEVIHVTKCDPRDGSSCNGSNSSGSGSSSSSGGETVETAAAVGVVVLKGAWCFMEFVAALGGGGGHIDCD
jgi:hypothetical protein